MATQEFAEGDLETRSSSSRLQEFFSSLFASIGGVFSQTQEPEMASRAVLPQNQLKGTLFLSSLNIWFIWDLFNVLLFFMIFLCMVVGLFGNFEIYMQMG